MTIHIAEQVNAGKFLADTHSLSIEVFEQKGFLATLEAMLRCVYL